jgi:hypothetical protein
MAACSSDDETIGPKEGTGGSIGSGGSGGSGGEAGGDTGGSAATCDSCAQQSCEAELAACSDSSACQPWLTCLMACSDQACAEACNLQNVGAAAMQAAIYACLCSSCDDACSGIDACNVCLDEAPLPLFMTPPENLSETGLYSDIASETLSAGVLHFEPKYPLWSDGAEKARYAYIPKCATIDTSDMDHWEMPVGTRFWKEFTRDGIRVETRLIHRFGPGPDDWIFAAYQWGVAPSEAVHVPDGVVDANGTGHDIPPESLCLLCHKGLPERVLGFSAFQLSHDNSGVGETMATLSAAGKLSVPKPEGFTVPGDAVDQAALGYLHANCGNCHNPTGVVFIDMHLRLLVSNTTVEATDTFTTAVGKPALNFPCNGCNRITPGDPLNSAVIIRMSTRAPADQMPPLATEIVDAAGVATVSEWIQSL